MKRPRKYECSRCGRPKDRMPQRYCKLCHAAHMRETRPKYAELTEEQRLKANARSYANTYERRGLLVSQPCEKCGSENSEKHHEDYSKPTDVRWMCRVCHLAEHRELIEA